MAIQNGHRDRNIMEYTDMGSFWQTLRQVKFKRVSKFKEGNNFVCFVADGKNLQGITLSIQKEH